MVNPYHESAADKVIVPGSSDVAYKLRRAEARAAPVVSDPAFVSTPFV